ncbi:TlpA family protein disulfide reductase [Allosphingosinicella humi]
MAQAMRKHQPIFPGRPACLLVLAILAACEQTPQAAMPDRQAAAAPVASNATDEFQTMAFNAGKDLIGTRAPTLSFRTIDGKTVRLGEPHAARPIYLKFWATWCVTCREQMDAFKADFARFGKDIDVVAVNTGVNDDLAAVEAYRRDLQLPMPIAIDDGRLGEAFHLKVTPQHIIIGRDGTIRYVGHLEDERLQRELQAAIAGQPASRELQVEARPTEGLGWGASSPGGAFTSVQGGQVRIDGPTQGTVRLIYFLSPWCETYLKDSRPAMARKCKDTREALTRVASTGGAEVIGIASGLSADVNGVRRFLRRTGFAAPIVMDTDGQLFRRFGVRSFPTVIQLDVVGRPSRRLGVSEIDALASQATA